MAHELKWTPELESWLKERPASVQKVAKIIHPLGVYALTIHGEQGDYYRVTGYGEATDDLVPEGERVGTVSLCRFEKASLKPKWGVFGVRAEDLTLIGEVDPVTGMMTFYRDAP